MDMFSWLLLGHLLGDWLLQNDWMARGKRQRLITLAGMAHFITYTIMILIMIWLYNQYSLNLSLAVAVGGIVFVSHWLIDATNLVQIWMRFYGQSDRELMRIMVDQTLHLLMLGLLTLFPLVRW